jgi:hypothetical protein
MSLTSVLQRIPDVGGDFRDFLVRPRKYVSDRRLRDKSEFTVFFIGSEKTGKLMPQDMRGRYTVIEWLMFQMGGVGPMFGQAGHFRNAAPEKIPYAIERYTKETHRLCDVMNKRLGEAAFLGGDYSIADIATYPWVVAGLRHEPARRSPPAPTSNAGSTPSASVPP